MFGRKCSSPVCLRDFILFIFLAALSANLHCGKTLGLEKSFEHGKIFREYGWETRTFEEGKKKAPLIQGGGLRQAHTIEKVENPSSRLLISIKPHLSRRKIAHQFLPSQVLGFRLLGRVLPKWSSDAPSIWTTQRWLSWWTQSMRSSVFFLCSTRLTGDFVGFWYKQNAE